MARKAINLKLVSQKQYKEYMQECSARPIKKPFAKNTQENTFKTIIKENSKNFVEAIIAQTHNNKLDFKTAMDYLGVKEMKHFRGMQEVLSNE